MNLFKDYANTSSICGFKYISNGTIIDRIFWIMILIMCFYGSYLLTISSYMSYLNNSISFAVDTNYLDWNTTFPTIAICEKGNKYQDAAIQYLETYFEESKDDWTFIDFVNDVATNPYCTTCAGLCGKDHPLCYLNFTALTENVTASCEEMFRSCSWNGALFECCSKFQRIMMETGYCHILDSHATRNIHPNMISNKDVGPGELSLVLNRDAKVYLVSPYESPTHNTRTEQVVDVRGSYECTILFTAQEMVNDVNIKFQSQKHRKCRFPDEPNNHRYKTYSRSACLVDCRARKQLELCNCTHHHFSSNYKGTKCDGRGLGCISAFQYEFMGFRSASENYGLVCDCPNLCVETEYQVIYSPCIKRKKYRGNLAQLNIRMASLPVVRLKRNVIRSKLDLVVSVGGTAGLFLGVSLLSVVEMFMFCIRPILSRMRIKTYFSST